MIIPTILETDLKEIINKIDLLKNVAELIQIDLAESNLVNGETYLDISFLKDIKAECDFEIDLMVNNPSLYVKNEYSKIKRACAYIKGEELFDFFNLCAANNYLAGISLSPDDPLELFKPYSETVDYVEFITVEPGGQGRTFDQNCLKTIEQFKKMYPDIPIQVDGGVNEQTIKDLLNLGVNDFVIGSAIFASGDPVAQFKLFKERLKNAQ